MTRLRKRTSCFRSTPTNFLLRKTGLLCILCLVAKNLFAGLWPSRYSTHHLLQKGNRLYLQQVVSGKMRIYNFYCLKA